MDEHLSAEELDGLKKLNTDDPVKPEGREYASKEGKFRVTLPGDPKFKAVDTGSLNHNAKCVACGYRSNGKSLCLKCWRGARIARFVGAAAAVYREVA